VANKLRDLFDDDSPEVTVKLSFSGQESYSDLLTAVKKATEEGEPSTVNGITGITIAYKDGESQYPIENHDEVSNFMVFPYDTPLRIVVSTDKGKRELKFCRKNLKDGFELRNIDGRGASYKITLNTQSKSVSLNYNASYDEANSLEEMIDYYNTLYFFSKNMFRRDIQSEEVENVLNHFISAIIYFERLKRLSDVLNIEIKPNQVGQIDNEDWFIDQVFFALVENKIIRSNRKVNCMNNVHFSNDKKPNDNPMIVTYLEQVHMSLLDKEVDVFIVSMAFNLIVDREEHEEDGNTKLFFKDDEKNPMYIASKMFLDLDDAKNELKNALDDKEPYAKAKTLFDYIKDAHEALISQKDGKLC